jgi:hypothetical protein
MEEEVASSSFFSKDKRIIIKTIPEIELNKLEDSLKEYHTHFMNNQRTCIAKILGIYTYQRGDSMERYHLLMMKNLCGYPSKFVERTFDMKGSSVDRQVIKPNEENIQEKLRKNVLKDMDFLQFEEYFKVSGKTAQFLRKQLMSDVDFLRSCELIDYSLIVFKINKAIFDEELIKYKKFVETNKQLLDERPNNKQTIFEENGITDMGFFIKPNDGLRPFKSIAELGIVYHIGIIDYLQPYNFSKKFEKYFKRIKKGNLKAEVSSVDPSNYAARFKNRLEGIIPASTGGEGVEEDNDGISRHLTVIELETRNSNGPATE